MVAVDSGFEVGQHALSSIPSTASNKPRALRRQILQVVAREDAARRFGLLPRIGHLPVEPGNSLLGMGDPFLQSEVCGPGVLQVLQGNITFTGQVDNAPSLGVQVKPAAGDNCQQHDDQHGGDPSFTRCPQAAQSGKDHQLSFPSLVWSLRLRLCW